MLEISNDDDYDDICNISLLISIIISNSLAHSIQMCSGYRNRLINNRYPQIFNIVLCI